ncbi:type IV toxin-antitoxin system AbiEi family antitoxin domain-containing protein [Deinococcus budaensis]|uniref:type IV toxin-antitoxin system AbiEi family antitoxin domain-containing protein n=1 Tax=Deinococcus budaensis TaxID=1665626 RepID=UPI001FE84C5D|nr:type IV toxin-antitoxin system AbiEi family antitoxin domain-containing protein [Deinococcus budaensis]
MPEALNTPLERRWATFRRRTPPERARLVTAAQLKEAGFQGVEVTRLVERGQLERVERGVYALPSAGGSASSHAERLAELQLRFPKTVACLESAASLLRLTTAEPLEIDLALPRRSVGRTPQADGVHFHWMTDEIYLHGQTVDTSTGTPIRTFDAPKTVADFCARRHKLGRETYLTILKAYLEHGGLGGTPGATSPLLAAARVCRVEKVIRADLAVLRA